MGNVAYMSLFNSNQQQILGCSPVYDREGCIEIQKIDYNINRAVDSQTGKSHSTRRHQPLSILKQIDRSTPELTPIISAIFRYPKARSFHSRSNIL